MSGVRLASPRVMLVPVPAEAARGMSAGMTVERAKPARSLLTQTNLASTLVPPGMLPPQIETLGQVNVAPLRRREESRDETQRGIQRALPRLSTPKRLAATTACSQFSLRPPRGVRLSSRAPWNWRSLLLGRSL